MSQPVRIGAGSHIADRDGTHEPGTVVDYPTPALLALAEAQTVDPETGEPYCELVGSQPAKKSPPATPAPAPDAPTPETT